MPYLRLTADCWTERSLCDPTYPCATGADRRGRGRSGELCGIEGYIFVPVDPTQLDAPPIEPRLFALADESRAFYAARGTGPGPQSAAEVHRLREQRMADPRPRDPRAVDLTAEWAGRAVTLRVITPEVSARGVVLDLHGGGFYLGSAADHDSWNLSLIHI